MSKQAKIITPAATIQAHRRRLPSVITSINAKLRDGKRSFMAVSDFMPGMFPLVVQAFRRQPGWEVSVTNRFGGMISVRLPGEARTD